MKTLLLLFSFVFLLFNTNAQTWKKPEKLSVTKNGKLITAKWTNQDGGVTTRLAECNEWVKETKYYPSDKGTIEETVYRTTCTCTNGNYFELSKFYMFFAERLTVSYYNSLDKLFWREDGLTLIE